jgi:ribosomal protein S18 acetylase RimI-like enzyme
MTARPEHAVNVVNHRDLGTAQRIHDLMALAHAQEAALLQQHKVAPWAQTLQDIQSADEFFLVVTEAKDWCGLISVRPDDEPGQINIASLVVHPEHQRKGVASTLLTAALQRGHGAVFSVSTTAANAPALALYGRFGFEAYRWGTLGEAGLALVKLRRAAAIKGF